MFLNFHFNRCVRISRDGVAEKRKSRDLQGSTGVLMDLKHMIFGIKTFIMQSVSFHVALKKITLMVRWNSSKV